MVWPAPPETPRVRFLGEIHGEIGSKRGNTFQHLLFGPDPARRLITPQAVAVDATGTRVAIADPDAGGVHILEIDRKNHVFIGRDASDGALIGKPVALSWARATLFIVEGETRTVTACCDGKAVRSFGQDVLTRPAGIAFHGSLERLFVSDAAAHKVFAFDLSGRVVTRFGQRGSGPGEFNFPTHVAVTPDGELMVTDSLNFRIQRLTPDGRPISVFGQKGDAGGDFALPKGVAVDADGNIWVVDAQFENIQAFDREGRLLMALGREGHGPGEFWLPNGLAIDDKNRLWVADTYNRRVQIFELLR